MVVKTSINLTPGIIEKVDEMVGKKLFENRSHAIRNTLEEVWGINAATNTG